MKVIFIPILTAALYIIPQMSLGENVQIEFTENDAYSIEVARIKVGDSIEWLPTDEGHNVQFLAGPLINSLPPKSKIDERHIVVFSEPGVYLYGCTPHANMGMLGLVIVGNDLHNLESIKKIHLSSIATSVLKRLIRIANSVSH